MNQLLNKIIVFSLLVFLSFAQNVKAHVSYKGQIQNIENDEPVWGANIIVEGTSIGTTTDEQGQFILITDSIIPELTISHLGFLSTKIIPQEGILNVINLEKAPLNIKDVVVNANAKLGDQSINAIDISLKQVKSSQEVLRFVPGLIIGQHAGGGKAEQIFLRGYDIDHGTDLSISVDGIPVNMVSHAHGQGYSDLHFLIPELISKVNFDKGPYNAEFGNFATAAYVDFRTMNQLKKNMVQIEAGSFNRFRVLGMVDILGDDFSTKKNQNAYIAAEYIQSDGPFESPQNFKRFNTFYKHSYRLGKKHFLKTQASYFRSSWDASGQIPESAVENGIISRFGAIDDQEGGQTDRTNISLNLQSIINDNLSLENQVYYSNYNFRLFSNFTFFLEDTINGDRIKQQEFRNLFGAQTQLSWKKQKNQLRSNTLFGIGFRQDLVNGNELSHVADRETTLEKFAFGDVEETNLFVFASENIKYKKWNFNIGLRYDVFRFNYINKLENTEDQNLAQTINPKLNIAYNFSNKAQMYFKIGSGFHSNDTRSAVYASQNSDILPRVWGADLGTNLNLFNRMVLGVAGWTLYQENELIYVGDAGIVEENGSSIRAGIDVSTRLQILQWLFAEANVNYTYARSLESEKGENYIPLAPWLTSTGGLYVKHKSGINGSLSYRYLADRAANEDASLTASGYMLLDAELNYTRKKYQIGISVENLLNSEWNEAQFETESRITPESSSTTEIHFTPGTPINISGKLAFFF